jgi:hypothetical protein
MEIVGYLLLIEEAVVATTHWLLLAENREGIPFAVAGYLRYKCNPVRRVQRDHKIVASLRGWT